MICPACKIDNIEGVDECDSCGEPLTQEVPATLASELEDSAAMTALSDVASPAPVKVAPTATVSEVVDRLIAASASCVLVVGPDGCLMGIVSERDLLYKVADRYEQLKSSPIHEFMTPDPETLKPDATVAWALNRMDVGGFRHIPIVENSRPQGVVAVRDLLAHLSRHYMPAGS